MSDDAKPPADIDAAEKRLRAFADVYRDDKKWSDTASDVRRVLAYHGRRHRTLLARCRQLEPVLWEIDGTDGSCVSVNGHTMFNSERAARKAVATALTHGDPVVLRTYAVVSEERIEP